MAMIHIKEKGTNQHVIFLLHGTGGNIESMIELGRLIDSDATLISIQGEVNEDGMQRYFARYPDGTFDLESLNKETIKLNTTIQDLKQQYDLKNYRKSILGYSNGANIATNLFKEFETDFDSAILYHPSAVRMDIPFMPQTNLKVFMTYGQNDPFLSENDFITMKSQFEEKNIQTTVYTHFYGHQLIEEELIKTKIFLKAGELGKLQ